MTRQQNPSPLDYSTFGVFEHAGQVVSSSVSLAVFFGADPAIASELIQRLMTTLPELSTVEPARAPFLPDTSESAKLAYDFQVWFVGAEGLSLLFPYFEARTTKETARMRAEVLRAYREAADQLHLQQALKNFWGQPEQPAMTTGENKKALDALEYIYQSLRDTLELTGIAMRLLEPFENQAVKDARRVLTTVFSTLDELSVEAETALPESVRSAL